MQPDERTAATTDRRDWATVLLSELDYYRVRMMVAVSFLDSETLDTFHEHVAEIDAKHREGTYAR